MELYYLGPAKTFSEQAALALAEMLGEAADLKPSPNFEAIARAVAAGVSGSRCFGVLPYYNLLEGLVQENLDLIYEYILHIVGAKRVPVEFAAGVHPDASQATVTVYSHPKGLAQCSDYVQARIPGAVAKPVSSTAEAARIVRETGEGLAIASRAALLEYGLTILDEDIGNRRQGRSNFTDFLLVTMRDTMRDRLTPSGEGNWRTMMAITPNIERVGLLAEILGQFAFYGLNIAKVHSRPAIDTVSVAIEPQMFYLEVMCDRNSESLRRCAEALTYHFRSDDAPSAVRVLGSFAEVG
jgi:prephenate dehydratase